MEAVLFDMDGLLLDTERLALRAWMEGAAALGAELSEATVLETIGVDWERTRRIIAAALPGGEEDFPALQREVQGIYHRLLETDLVIKPGAAELLAALKERGVPMGLATSTTREGAERRLTKARLLGYFSGSACGDEITNGKPAPDIFLLSAQRVGADPAHCVVLEDSPAGLRGARDAGMRTIWVPDLVRPEGDGEHLADWLVKDLWEAKDILFSL